MKIDYKVVRDELLRYPKILPTLIVGILVLVASFILSMYSIPYTWPLAFFLLFTFFDVIGFSRLIAENERIVEPLITQNPEIALLLDRNTAAYRILQTSFHIIFLLMIFGMAGWKVALAAELLHWFGACELFYYWLVDHKLPENWDWVSWTAFGTLSDSPIISNNQMITQSIIGIILCLILVLI